MEDLAVMVRRAANAVELAQAATVLSSRNEILSFLTTHIHEIIPCDKAAMNQCDLATGEVMVTAMDDQPTSFHIPLSLNHRDTPLPLLSHFESTRRLEGARLSDIAPARWRDTASYSEVYRPMGAEHQAAIVLEWHEPIVWGVAMNRSTVDFTESDITLLNILGSIVRPSLAAYIDRQRILDLLATNGSQRSLITFGGDWQHLLDVPEVAGDLLAHTDYASSVPGFNHRLGELARSLKPLIPRRVDGVEFTRLPQTTAGTGTLLIERVSQSNPLTNRQREILEFVNRGLSTKEIARSLGISRRTVETHIQNTYSRLQVNNRVQAVNRARTRSTPI